VFYVQYAHARICSIVRKAAGEEVAAAAVDADSLAAEIVQPSADLSLLVATEELALMRRLSEFADVVEVAARELAPNKLTRYAEDLAASFHQCRVVSDDTELTAARLYAVDATRRALRCVLDLLGVSAPERM
jgi:arginyl-tRNA synthetase